MYALGEGVPENYTEAAKWHSRAAEQGHPNAQFSLCMLYQHGLGVRKDCVRAYMLMSLGDFLWLLPASCRTLLKSNFPSNSWARCPAFACVCFVVVRLTRASNDLAIWVTIYAIPAMTMSNTGGICMGERSG